MSLNPADPHDSHVNMSREYKSFKRTRALKLLVGQFSAERTDHRQRNVAIAFHSCIVRLRCIKPIFWGGWLERKLVGTCKSPLM